MARVKKNISDLSMKQRTKTGLFAQFLEEDISPSPFTVAVVLSHSIPSVSSPHVLSSVFWLFATSRFSIYFSSRRRVYRVVAVSLLSAMKPSTRVVYHNLCSIVSYRVAPCIFFFWLLALITIILHLFLLPRLGLVSRLLLSAVHAAPFPFYIVSLAFVPRLHILSCSSLRASVQTLSISCWKLFSCCIKEFF